MRKDSTHSISSSMVRFFSGTLLSRLTGLAREMTTAAAFGCHPAVAAFWMAFRFSNLLRRLFGEGAMQMSFVPHFEELRLKSSGEAIRFFRDLSLGITLLVLLIIAFSELVLLGVLHWGNVSAGNREVLQLTAIMLPGALFICLFGLNAGFLQCYKSYFIPAVAPVAFNLCWIGAVIWFRDWLPSKHVMAYFSIAVVVAYIVQWFFTMPKIMSIAWQDLRSEIWHKIQWFTKDFVRFKGNLFISIIGVGAVQINSGLDVIFARAADSSGPAYLSYALRLQQMPLGLFGISIAGALLPPLSRAMKAGDMEKAGQFLTFAIKRCIGIMVPSTLAILVLAPMTVNLIYGRGDFSQEATSYTAWCLSGYSVGLLPMTLVFLLASASYAKNNYRMPTLIAVISVVVNILLNYFFVFILKWGAVSVALATSISAFVNGFILLRQVSRKIITLDREILVSLGKVCFVSLIASLAALFGGDSLDQVIRWGYTDFPRNFISQVYHFALPGVIFVLVVLVGSKIFKVSEILDLIPRKRR